MAIDILEQQQKYNKAFESWEKKGFVKDCSEYKVIFDCIYKACMNVSKSMLKSKVYIDDVADKALDCTLLIMDRHELQRHVKIESLGAYVKYPLMNFLWSKSVKRIDKETRLYYENLMLSPVQGEQFFEINGRNYYTTDNQVLKLAKRRLFRCIKRLSVAYPMGF